MTQNIKGKTDDETDGAPPPARVRWALASLSLSMLMPSLDTSIANVSLPALVQSFAASFQNVQWVVLAYLIAITSLIVSAGRLGDIIGRRRLLLAGIALFSAASLLCSVAPTLALLVAARAIQGLGAAIMMTLTLAMVAATVPKARAGQAMGLLGTMSAFGTTLGPALGGVLIAGLGWPAIFLINVPIGMVNFYLARRYLPTDRPVASNNRAGFDAIGTVLLAFALAAYALAMTTGHPFGPRSLALLSVSIFGVILFVFAQARVASPLVQLAMFRQATLRAGLAMNVLVATVMMTTLVVGPFYLMRGLGLDAARSGLVMAVGPLVAALSGIPAGRIVDRLGTNRTTIFGLAGMAAGLLTMTIVPELFGVAGYITAIVVVTASYALFQAANTTAVMTGVHPDQRGVVSGMLNLSRNIGLITGASAMGAVFAFAAAAKNIAAAPPQAANAGMRATFGLAALLMVAALTIAVNGRGRTAQSGRRP